MQAAWYNYPYDNAFGSYPDPFGPYPKPDTNFSGIPVGSPITALASGTVTNVRRMPWSPLAYSVTVKLDNAWNSIAQYTAYNYVSFPTVSAGQHVSPGDTLAYSGNPYNVGTAFALTDTPVYGTGSSNEPFSGTYVNPALNPVPFLQAAINPGNGGGTLTGILNETNLNTGPSSSNSVFNFDWTRFIDATLLFIIGLVLVIVGALLLLNRMNINPSTVSAA